MELKFLEILISRPHQLLERKKENGVGHRVQFRKILIDWDANM